MLHFKASSVATALAALGVLTGATARAQEYIPGAQDPIPAPMPPVQAQAAPAPQPPPPPPVQQPPQQMQMQVQVAAPAQPGPAQAAPAQEQNPIPPYVEGQAYAATSGGYCYGGPHPAPGGGWEAVQGTHMHNYAPFDLRLFAYRNGCYYFIGDPRDFGYTGQVYSYYGAHPILDSYGGGWCFMIGPHYHWWRPWSPYFTVVGPWYYWYGPYDPFFWAYWPYYSFYYRSYYPAYYAGGRYYRTYRAAPGITRVPPTGWRGSPAGAASWRGSPTASAGAGWRGYPTAPAATAPLRSYAAPATGGWHGSSVPAPMHTAPPGGGFHAAPSGGFHPTPSGGFHSGGGFRGGRGGRH
jgi:hypothetical protein